MIVIVPEIYSPLFSRYSGVPGSLKRRISHSPKGLTLLELLVSLGLFVVLLSVLWNVVSLFTRTQDQGTRLAERSQLVRSLSQLLEDDLRAAIQDPIHPSVEKLSGDDDVRRFGLNGTTHTLRVDVIEIDPFADPTASGERRVAAMGDVSPSAPRVPELKTVFYEMRPAGLFRREIDFETPDGAATPIGVTMSAPEVVDCRFRYFDGSQWSGGWESLQRNGLPVAIEATIRLVAISDVKKLRQKFSDESLDAAVQRLEISTPSVQRIVAYLPASPILKHEPFTRTSAPSKPQPPQPPKSESPIALPPVNPPPPSPPPASRPQQSWIRGS